MSQNRTIGRVLSVDNFRVFIKIDDDLKGTYKSGISDIYEVARINSYLIIPVGSDRIVALITRITMKEEMEIDKNTTSISLPNSARYISATMLGTITQKDGKDYFIQGVYSFPALDNPVWYVTKKDLDQIFDSKDNKNIKYESDFYLPIGTSPAFQDYHVKICPDQFFVKHAAILGNTGSGKSCTLTSILRNLFRYNFNGQNLINAHFVIFDTNGEYKSAFLANHETDDKTKEELHQINTYYYGGEEKVQIPYWLMNWQDFKTLLKPSDGTQAPILNSAIGLAKNEVEATDKKLYSRALLQTLQDILEQIQVSKNVYWKIKNYASAIDDIKSKDIKIENISLNEILDKIPNSNGDDFNAVKPSEIEDIVNELSLVINKMNQANLSEEILNEQNIDLPLYFDYKKLCTKFLDMAISQNDTSNSKINEFVSTLRLRMNSFLNDKRIAIPLMLKDSNEFNKDILPQFLALIFGDYRKCFEGKDEDNFIKKYNEEFTKQYDSHSFNQAKNTNQITIVDISQLPYDVLEIITGLLGRIILEFVANFSPEQRGKYPIVIVLEEAQNYIAENKDSVSKKVFERIAREGRKYGISLIVSSQRPSELSKTVLSQCNSFIIHRLQNPDDQKYVRGLISSANADLLEQLPIIPQQHAIITGDCVRTPVQVRIDDVSPQPNSNNPKYISNWIEDTVIPYKETCNRWICSNNETDKKQ